MRTFNEIVEEILKIPAIGIRDELTSRDVPEWDSMNYLLFIAEIEKEYDFSFSMSDVLDAKCLGDIRRVVESHKKSQ